MKEKIEIESDGRITKLLINGVDFSMRVTGLKLQIEPMTAPILTINLIPDSITFKGDAVVNEQPCK